MTTVNAAVTVPTNQLCQVAYFGAAYAQRRHGYVMDAIHMPTRTPHAALSATSRTLLAVLTKSI
jgi:hypothetical protein